MSCSECKSSSERVPTDLPFEVGDQQVVVAGHAMRCTKCGTVGVMPDEAEAAGRKVAEWVARHGKPSPFGMKFIRRAAGISAVEVASLLDTDKETVSRWENGKQAFPRSAWATVTQLVLETLAGRSEMRDRLKALHAPPPADSTVRLSAPSLNVDGAESRRSAGGR